MENFTSPSFAAAILEFWMVMDRPGWCHAIAQIYIGKLTEGFLSTPCGSEMAVKISAWGNVTPPLTVYLRFDENRQWACNKIYLFIQVVRVKKFM